MKVKGCKNLYHTNINLKKAYVSILKSDKVEFRETKQNPPEPEGYNVIIKGSIHQEDISILNVYVSNSRTAKYV